MGTNFGGWYVLLGNYTMKIQVNVPTPKFVPTFLTFTKRNFLYNAPLIWKVQHCSGDYQILLLYSDLTGMYHYMGSLTTPGCNELVMWVVMETPMHIRGHGLVSAK